MFTGNGHWKFICQAYCPSVSYKICWCIFNNLNFTCCGQTVLLLSQNMTINFHLPHFIGDCNNIKFSWRGMYFNTFIYIYNDTDLLYEQIGQYDLTGQHFLGSFARIKQSLYYKWTPNFNRFLCIIHCSIVYRKREVRKRKLKWPELWSKQRVSPNNL